MDDCIKQHNRRQPMDIRLVSIINAWSDTVELLPFCIDNHLQFSDAVIVVVSAMSNHGNTDSVMADFIRNYPLNARVLFEHFEPFLKYIPRVNEAAKRNFGIQRAIENPYKFTHYLMADADEFYIPEDVQKEKKRLSCVNGLVCRTRVYIKTPKLWTEDHTLVPFIQRLHTTSVVGNFKYFPFAYDESGAAHIDPTRRPNFTNGIEMSDIICHHFSYVRKNIDLKINNSSANLRRSVKIIYEELHDAKPGYVSKLYHSPLKESENLFNIHI